MRPLLRPLLTPFPSQNNYNNLRYSNNIKVKNQLTQKLSRQRHHMAHRRRHRHHTVLLFQRLCRGRPPPLRVTRPPPFQVQSKPMETAAAATTRQKLKSFSRPVQATILVQKCEHTADGYLFQSLHYLLCPTFCISSSMARRLMPVTSHVMPSLSSSSNTNSSSATTASKSKSKNNKRMQIKMP